MDGPFIPGTATRLYHVPGDHPDLLRIRNEIQEGGPGLHVFTTHPLVGVLVVAEAYAGEDVRPATAASLDRPRAQDYRDGRLVIVAFPPYRDTVQVGDGVGSYRVAPRGVTPGMVEECRRNNRAANRSLKRMAPSEYRAQEARNRMEREEEEAVAATGYYDAYADAILETRKLLKPRVYT